MNTESLTFTDLPQDIIDGVIFFLPQRSIQALSQTCKLLHLQINNSSYVWQLLYKKTFGSAPTPFKTNSWTEKFNLRRGGQIYSWGALVGGRLGFSSNEVDQESVIRQGFNSGVCKPTKVPDIDEFVIADVSAGGFSIQFLTSKGKIYSIGSWHSGHRGPGPDQPDYNPLHSRNTMAPPTNHPRTAFSPGRLGGVRIGGPVTHLPVRGQGTQVRQTIQIEKKENRFVSKQFTINEEDITFVSISSGRAHFVALDNAGNLWSWDDPRTNCGVRIVFNDKDEDMKNHKVLKCLAGWGSSVAYLYGYGLVYWNKRLEVKEGDCSVALHSKIPGTGDVNGEERIIDFVSGDGFIVYLTAGGKLYRNDMIGEESYQLDKFTKRLTSSAISLKPMFTRLSGNFNTFACFSNEDLVLLGLKDNDEPLIIEELQGKNCLSIAVGDYHTLALLEDGTLLSWGLESNSCGCLGLGKEPEGATMEGINSKRVKKPTIVETNGKVLAISAAGWQSCAIINEL